MRKHHYMLAAGLAVAVGTGLASAQNYVYVPNINENTPGASNNSIPFDWDVPMRLQQVFAASEFGGQSGIITQIAFRIDESAGHPFSTSGIDTEVRLCHTSVIPTQMNTTFDNNYGSDVTLVYDGLLSLSSSGNGFDIIIDIDDVFEYDGVSNLLVEYKLFSGATSSSFDAAGTGLGEGGLPSIDRLWAEGANAVTGSSSGDDGYVTRLTIEPGGGYVLGVIGNCPGQLAVSWRGATPGRQQGLVFGASQGHTTIPNGVCRGTVLGVQGQVRLVNTFGTGSGSGSINGNAGTASCGHFLQLVESGTCNTSNVKQIP